MSTSYDVRVWAIKTRKRGKSIRYIVRWTVGGEGQEKWFKLWAQADSFRSALNSAAKRGEAFDITEGLPIGMLRAAAPEPEPEPVMTWFEFACAFADLKWDEAPAPKSRKTTADSLIPITLAMLADNYKGKITTLTRALRWAFNKNRRDEIAPDHIAKARHWASRHTRPVADLKEPSVLRSVLRALEKNMDKRRAAPDTIRLRRIAFRDSLDYAVELKLLDTNPVAEVKSRKQKTVLREVDRRCVANPIQARTLLLAVRQIQAELVAFFAVMYFAGLRPEEAVNLRKENLSLPAEVWNEVKQRWELPEDAWGDIHLERAAPEIGYEWTDSGEREERSLKHRDDGVSRTIPCCPELTAHLHEHLRQFGTTPDGRLFHASRDDGWLSSSLYGRVWTKAREAVFVPHVVASPLAKRPYDLRHACVSTWLNASVEPPRVAEWAGHSVAVLLRVYAKCIDGGEQEARRRVAARLMGR